MQLQRFAICLVVALHMSQTHAAIRASVTSSLSKISTKLNTYGKNVQTKVTKITQYLNLEEEGEIVDAVSSSIETMGGAVEGITSSDALSIVGGTMEMLSAITALIPIYGQIASTVFGLVSSIIGAIGGSDDVGSIVRREIETALNNYEDSELRADAEGTMRVYRVSQAYLGSLEENGQINDNDVSALAANVPVHSGVQFLGKLSTKIKENAAKSDSVQVKRAAEYTQLYVILAVMRSAILWEMYSIAREAPDSVWTANAIKRVALSEENHDKDFLTFLTAPVYSKAIFFAYFNISEWPVTKRYMFKLGLGFERYYYLPTLKRYIKPKEWTNWYMVLDSGPAGIMLGTTLLNDQSRYIFQTISAENNIFYIRSAKWPTWYVIMSNTPEGFCKASGSTPGDEGKWKAIRFDDGYFLLSSIKWPNWFIYMMDNADGHIAGHVGDPGDAGHWLIH